MNATDPQHTLLSRHKELGLSAFALGSKGCLAGVPRSVFGQPLHHIDSDDKDNLLFCMRLNAGNNFSYGGDGMPEWVQLDCAMQPAAFFGVQGPAKLLVPDARKAIDALVAGKIDSRAAALAGIGFLPRMPVEMRDDDIVPLSEFCALPRMGRQSRTIVGFSLFRLPLAKDIKGFGFFAKAIGLSVHYGLGASRQVGIAQYDKPAAISAHCRFGELDLQQVLAPFHTNVGRTFIYSLEIPGPERLAAIADPDGAAKPELKDAVNVRAVDPADLKALARMDARNRAGTHQYKIIPPGVGTVDGRKGVLIREIEL